MGFSNFISDFRARQRAKRGMRNEHLEWAQRKFEAPSPANIKRSVLMRLGHPGGTWVETGTFMGDTTALLTSSANAVYTIEPEHTLYEKAARRFAEDPKVTVLHGLSENVFPTLLPTLKGIVNFWLDGHYSGGITHQGPTDCPVREELQNIQANLHLYDKVAVLIDDMRCFNPTILEYSDYPSLDYLVDWARSNHLNWHIEHDIFAAVSQD
jgi:hypothetical protein